MPICIVIIAIQMYMLGLSVASIAIVIGKQAKTVERWIRRIVPQCGAFTEHKLEKARHEFTPAFLQLDELWTWIACSKKDACSQTCTVTNIANDSDGAVTWYLAQPALELPDIGV
jgi:transposase